jgi:hypothetical protein
VDAVRVRREPDADEPASAVGHGDGGDAHIAAHVRPKVEEFDGTYDCLVCFESVRGQQAQRCSECMCQPWHTACAGSLDKCPMCQRSTVVPWDGRATVVAPPEHSVDLTAPPQQGAGGAQAQLQTSLRPGEASVGGPAGGGSPPDASSEARSEEERKAFEDERRAWSAERNRLLASEAQFKAEQRVFEDERRAWSAERGRIEDERRAWSAERKQLLASEARWEKEKMSLTKEQQAWGAEKEKMAREAQKLASHLAAARSAGEASDAELARLAQKAEAAATALAARESREQQQEQLVQECASLKRVLKGSHSEKCSLLVV